MINFQQANCLFPSPLMLLADQVEKDHIRTSDHHRSVARLGRLNMNVNSHSFAGCRSSVFVSSPILTPQPKTNQYQRVGCWMECSTSNSGNQRLRVGKQAHSYLCEPSVMNVLKLTRVPVTMVLFWIDTDEYVP